MNKRLIALWVVLALTPIARPWAQTLAATGSIDLDAERDRLTQQQKTVDERYEADRTLCYKKFAVQNCLDDARARRRIDNDDIRRQTATLNDIERQRRGTDELNKLDQKNSSTAEADAEARRQDALKSQQDREQRAADHAASRAQTAAQEADQRRSFESKQQNHAEDVAKAARERAAEPASVKAYEDKQKQAREHRADVERRNAANTKPRSAPLPAHDPKRVVPPSPLPTSLESPAPAKSATPAAPATPAPSATTPAPSATTPP